jgi:hypothetical protein
MPRFDSLEIKDPSRSEELEFGYKGVQPSTSIRRWRAEFLGLSGLSFCGQDHKELVTALCPFCVIRLAFFNEFHDLGMI